MRDRGIGVPHDGQGRIFDKFYRGRHVTGMSVQGVGIGLALVRHVIEGHGGSIALESGRARAAGSCCVCPAAYERAAQQRPLGLEALVVRDPMLQRVMASVVVNPARTGGVDEAGAIAFERYLLDPSTQARIRAFRHHGLTEQTWWPAGRNNAGSELSGLGNQT